MKACVRHWKVDYKGFCHHFLDFRRLPSARKEWGYRCILELVRHPNACVRRTNWETVLEEASGEKPVLVRELNVELDRIFLRAQRKLDRQRYNFFLYNCEHFANECMIGARRSLQVRARTAQAATSVFSGIGAIFLLQQQQLEAQSAAVASAMGVLSLACGLVFARFVVRSTRLIHRFRRRQKHVENRMTPAL